TSGKEPTMLMATKSVSESYGSLAYNPGLADVVPVACTSSLYLSGAPLAPHSAAVLEFGPVLWSIPVGWPNASCILAPTRRAMMSLPPPGGKPTTMRIDFEG